ncbi:hypothetical protein [Streptomyces sp. NBC_01217]|uniref:hypothetical protein n=1 Tax=Streptomyces sp. NBC_01217 TaxID=2903779 RepID=UPI002E15EAE7|nr:hypothetical protein OG507_11285 [Streptomyces sp. NBC_01217]
MPDSANATTSVRNAVRRRYRFREYHVTTAVDPMALSTFEAVCVTGEDTAAPTDSPHNHGHQRNLKRADQIRAQQRLQIQPRTGLGYFPAGS